MILFFLFFSTVSSPILIGYDSDEEEYMSEYEYVDPYEGEGPISTTPPPKCDMTKDHEVCIPPAWGEEIPGDLVRCRCLLCHQEDQHHPIRCVQCQNAPGCCTCIWGYMRSQYNSGCPLCRAGDPQGENPLGADQRRVTPVPRNRHSLIVYNSRRGRGRRVGIQGAANCCGIGRARGRGRPAQTESQPEPQEEPQQQQQGSSSGINTARRSRRIALRRPGRGRSTTIEHVEEERKKKE